MLRTQEHINLTKRFSPMGYSRVGVYMFSALD